MNEGGVTAIIVTVIQLSITRCRSKHIVIV